MYNVGQFPDLFIDYTFWSDTRGEEGDNGAGGSWEWNQSKTEHNLCSQINTGPGDERFHRHFFHNQKICVAPFNN